MQSFWFQPSPLHVTCTLKVASSLDFIIVLNETSIHIPAPALHLRVLIPFYHPYQITHIEDL